MLRWTRLHGHFVATPAELQRKNYYYYCCHLRFRLPLCPAVYVTLISMSLVCVEVGGGQEGNIFHEAILN